MELTPCACTFVGQSGLFPMRSVLMLIFVVFWYTSFYHNIFEIPEGRPFWLMFLVMGDDAKVFAAYSSPHCASSGSGCRNFIEFVLIFRTDDTTPCIIDMRNIKKSPSQGLSIWFD
jgi:hypothetical protein